MVTISEGPGGAYFANAATVSGQLTDLYDFDHESGVADLLFVENAARVQAGYNTRGRGGHVYLVEADLNKSRVMSDRWIRVG